MFSLASMPSAFSPPVAVSKLSCASQFRIRLFDAVPAPDAVIWMPVSSQPSCLHPLDGVVRSADVDAVVARVLHLEALEVPEAARDGEAAVARRVARLLREVDDGARAAGHGPQPGDVVGRAGERQVDRSVIPIGPRHHPDGAAGGDGAVRVLNGQEGRGLRAGVAVAAGRAHPHLGAGSTGRSPDATSGAAPGGAGPARAGSAACADGAAASCRPAAATGRAARGPAGAGPAARAASRARPATSPARAATAQPGR